MLWKLQYWLKILVTIKNENNQTEPSFTQATIFCDNIEHLKDITPTKSTVGSTSINMYKGFHLNPVSIVKHSDNALIKYNTVENPYQEQQQRTEFI